MHNPFDKGSLVDNASSMYLGRLFFSLSRFSSILKK